MLILFYTSDGVFEICMELFSRAMNTDEDRKMNQTFEEHKKRQAHTSK